MGATKVHETWKHTHYLKAILKEAAEEIADILVTMALAKLAILVLVAAGFTTPERATCLIAGSSAAAIGYFINTKIITHTIEKL
jgi:hypothetical protein